MKKKFLKKNFELIKKILNNQKEDDISGLSAQCAYYTILSFVPLIILVITLIQYTSIDPKTLLNIVSKIVPSNMHQFILEIIQEIYSKSIGTISISLIFTTWSAGKGVFALGKGLKRIYKTENKKETYIYLRLTAFIQTILFIILIVLGLIISIFGNSLINIIQQYILEFRNYTKILGIFTELAFIFATFIIFLLLYKFVPKHKVTFKTQIPGAIFGAIILNIISFIFSKYLYIFKGFSITYGSLTTLILIMMWTYACFYTLFLGAEINK